MKNNNTINIFGVRINIVDDKSLLNLCINSINNKEQIKLYTPNPEILLLAKKDQEYKRILNKAYLNIADGIGIKWANEFLRSKLPRLPYLFKLILGYISIPYYIFLINNNYKRQTGTDLMEKIIINTNKAHKIFLLGSDNRSINNLKSKYNVLNKNLNIVGHNTNKVKENDLSLIKEISLSNANIIFIAIGAPRQEKWIEENIKKLPNIKLAIGVGGAIDFLSGTVKRAPTFIRKVHLEWFYRLLLDPKKRIKRIYNAVIKFPYYIMNQ